jgi:hypothetical protein
MYEPPTPPPAEHSPLPTTPLPPPPTAYANVAYAPEGAILAKAAYNALCSVHGVASRTWNIFVGQNKAFKQLAQSKVKNGSHARRISPPTPPPTRNRPADPPPPYSHNPTHTRWSTAGRSQAGWAACRGSFSPGQRTGAGTRRRSWALLPSDASRHYLPQFWSAADRIE